MIRVLFILLIAAITAASAGWLRQEYDSPGVTGLNTTYDFDALRPTDARALENADLSTRPGAIMNRFGVKTRGDSIGLMLSMAGYYNSEFGDKLLFGVSGSSENITIAKPRSTTDSLSPGNWTISWLYLKKIIASDNFRTVMDDTSLNESYNQFGTPRDYVAPADRYAWLKIYDQLVLCDGAGVPLSFSSRSSLVSDSFLSTNLPDYGPEVPTDMYRRRVLSLGLEAPGQLRARVTGIPGGPNGAYQYRYRYFGFDQDSCGYPGPPSAVVFPDSERVMLDLFESKAFRYKAGGGVDSSSWGGGFSHIQVERSKNNGVWLRLGDFILSTSDETIFIDSLGDNITDTADNWCPTPARSVPVPGSFYFHGTYDTTSPATERGNLLASTTLELDSYWVAYSYYDPINNLESPLGNYFKLKPGECLHTFGTDSVLPVVVKGVTDVNVRPHYIRIYRSAKNDSTTMFGFVTVPANRPYLDGNSVGYLTMGVPVGWGTDADMAAGLYEGCCGDYYGDPNYPNVLLYDETGGPMTRPPFTFGCEIPFSQLEWFANRAWGIGDPQYPQRLYYSAFDDVGNWNPSGYVSLDEDDDDEIVGMVSGDDDILYVFKRNKSFAVSGYDPEYDLQYSRMSTRHGAVNANCIVKVSPYVYILSGDYNIYRLVSGQVDTVSTQIDASIKEMFGTYRNMVDHARMFRFNESIWLTNDSTGVVYEFHFKEGIWTKRTSSSVHRYLGAFAFDTLDNSSGFGMNDDWMYLDNIYRMVKQQPSIRGIDSISTYITTPDLVYQTPFLGDGESTFELLDAVVTGKIVGADTMTVTLAAYDEKDSLLATKSYVWTMSRDRNGFAVGLGPCSGRFVSLRLTLPDCRREVTLDNLTLYYRRVGNVPIR